LVRELVADSVLPAGVWDRVAVEDPAVAEGGQVQAIPAVRAVLVRELEAVRVLDRGLVVVPVSARVLVAARGLGRGPGSASDREAVPRIRAAGCQACLAVPPAETKSGTASSSPPTS
jgi:hypothetical protein